MPSRREGLRGAIFVMFLIRDLKEKCLVDAKGTERHICNVFGQRISKENASWDGAGGDAPTAPLRNSERRKFRKNQEKTTKAAKTIEKPVKNEISLQNKWFPLLFGANVWFSICFAMVFNF